MRRSSAFLVAAGIVAAVVLGGPVPAQAATPAPPPVLPVPALPSQVVKSMTGTPIGDSVMLVFKALLNAPKTPAAPPVPIGPAAQLARTGAAGAGPLVGFQVGWALGQGGLQSYAIATGSTYEQLLCQQPEWYQGVNNFMLLSLAPTCAASVSFPNSDKEGSIGPVSYGGRTASVVGYRYIAAAEGVTACMNFSDTSTFSGFPSGYQLNLVWSPGTNHGSPGQPINTSAFTSPSHCANYTPGYSGNGGASTPSPGMTTATRITQMWLQGPTGKVPGTDAVFTRADPTRTPKCDITFNDGGHSLADGTPYKESEGIPTSAAGLGCGPAYTNYVSQPGKGNTFPDRIKVDADEGGVKTTIADTDVPEYSPEQQKSLTVPGTGAGLVLSKLVGTTLDSCNTWAADCTGWWTQSSNGTVADTYRCTFNGEPVALAECGVYRNTFDTKTSTPTITDPLSGNQADWVAGAPSTGGSTNPGAGLPPGDQCFADGWASVANPIEWVLVPVKCALVWAFVPRQAKVDEATDTVETTWRASTPGQLASSISGVTSAIQLLDAGHCGGIVLSVPKVGAGGSLATENRAFLAACPGDFFAPWAPIFYWFITAAIGIGGFFAIKRLLDRFVGNS